MSPDGSAKPLPEERLLKLIRGKAARSASSPAPSAAAAAVVLGQGMGRAARARRWPQMAAIGLGAVLLLELLLLIVEALRPAPTITMPVIPTPPVAVTPITIPPTPSIAQSVATPLFSTPADVGPIQPGPSPGPSETVTKLAARLTLLGIVAGNPAQAIIEDSQLQKTYFASPGQAVAEGAVVGTILDNRVILDFQGEQIELSL